MIMTLQIMKNVPKWYGKAEITVDSAITFVVYFDEDEFISRVSGERSFTDNKERHSITKMFSETEWN